MKKRLLAGFGMFIVCVGLAAIGLGLVKAAGDTEPPHVVGFDFEPKVVNVVLADQVITFTAHFTDDLSGLTDGEIGGIGVSPTQARFQSPSGGQLRDVLFTPPGDLVAGSPQDGIYESSMILPRFSEAGEWKMVYLLLADDVGNTGTLDADDMTARGLPSTFTVIDCVLEEMIFLPVLLK